MPVEVYHVLDGLALREVYDHLLDFHNFRCEFLTKGLSYLDGVLAPVSVEIEA